MDGSGIGGESRSLPLYSGLNTGLLYDGAVNLGTLSALDCDESMADSVVMWCWRLIISTDVLRSVLRPGCVGSGWGSSQELV
jgi:hypothetical protein